jgi:2-(1,2-epoxy-1,2-dihydrophenyl)acetyl-CoA isomerase
MRMKKPLVVLVNGPAAGAGLSLALAGDITGSADTRRLPRMISWARR